MIFQDGTGFAVAAYTYDAFGKITSSPATLLNPFQYTGREWDSETSLYYYRARYYDPTLGRFLSEDPTQFTAGVNFYEYTLNNPVHFGDPLGEDVTVTLWPGANGAGHIGVGVNAKPTETFGFYPSEKTFCILKKCTMPGAVLLDRIEHPGATPQQVVVHTTPAQDQQMQAEINKWKTNQGNYDLYSNNCAGFVEAVLNAGGVAADNTMFPKTLFEDLQKRYGHPAPKK